MTATRLAVVAIVTGSILSGCVSGRSTTTSPVASAQASTTTAGVRSPSAAATPTMFASLFYAYSINLPAEWRSRPAFPTLGWVWRS